MARARQLVALLAQALVVAQARQLVALLALALVVARERQPALVVARPQGRCRATRM